jgi:uncharacterized OsmC-like protein
MAVGAPMPVSVVDEDSQSDGGESSSGPSPTALSLLSTYGLVF